MYMAVASVPPPSETTTAALAGSAGLSGYVPDSTRERLMTFYPPPYGFAGGMGSCCASCASGGTCEGAHGMGLFDSGTDISGWGWSEWIIVGIGVFAVGSAVSNVTNAGRSLSRSVGGYRRRSKRKRALQQQLSRL